MKSTQRNPVVTFTLLGAGISSLLTGVSALAAKRQKSSEDFPRTRADRWAAERFGYPTGREGETPDVDQVLIVEITEVLMSRPKGLAS